MDDIERLKRLYRASKGYNLLPTTSRACDLATLFLDTDLADLVVSRLELERLKKKVYERSAESEKNHIKFWEKIERQIGYKLINRLADDQLNRGERITEAIRLLQYERNKYAREVSELEDELEQYRIWWEALTQEEKDKAAAKDFE